jgi:hypothetical protein
MASDDTGSQSGENWNPTLGDTEVVSVLGTLGQVEQQMPFLIGLSRDERMKLPKLGPANQAFVSDALSTAEANPGVLPRSLDIAKLRERARTIQNLVQVKQALRQMLEKVEDTEVRMTTEVYGAARTVYAVLKTPGTVPGLKDRRQRLAQRFARKPRKRSVESTTEEKTLG